MIDIDAYLARINYAEAREPTATTGSSSPLMASALSACLQVMPKRAPCWQNTSASLSTVCDVRRNE
jgi:hypothetical protein